MPEIQEEKQTSKGDKTRAALIEAAYTLFMEKGYHGTSMRQIAERAGLALGGIYNHFASKEDIFAATLDAHHPYRKILPALEQVTGETVEEFVRDAAGRIRAELQGAESKIVPLAFVELVEFQGRHLAQIVETFLPTLMGFVQKFSDRRGRLRDVPMPVMLRMFMMMMVGYFITEIVAGRVAAFKNLDVDWFEGMIDIYLHGILAKD